MCSLALALLLLLFTTAEAAAAAQTEEGHDAFELRVPRVALLDSGPLSCAELHARYAGREAREGPPPRHMPAALRVNYTMGLAAEESDYYVDDSNRGQGSHYRYGLADIDAMVHNAKAHAEHTGPGRHAPGLRRPTERWIVEAMRLHPPRGRVLVFGSMEPWWEAVLLAFGAEHVTTVEYNKLTYSHDAITTLTPPELLAAVPEGGFDAIVSISSFDHDGLGRYGDPLSPDADLRAMALARCLLRPGGYMYMTVPLGPDAIAWNLHRRYGKRRLPRMLAGWDVVAVPGWSKQRFEAPAQITRSYEPAFVLRPTAAADQEEL